MTQICTTSLPVWLFQLFEFAFSSLAIHRLMSGFSPLAKFPSSQP